MSKISDIDHELNRQSCILPGERSSFMLSVVALAAYIIQIDGDRTSHKRHYAELFLTRYYEAERAQHGLSLLSRVMAEQPKYNPLMWAAKIAYCAHDIAANTSVEQRMLVVDFLILVAKADEEVSPLEVMGLTNVAAWLGIAPVTSEKIQQLRTPNPYKS